MSQGRGQAVRADSGENERAVREAIASVDLWYHTLEVAPGIETPGWFDLRPIADRLPWPDVAGKRCLDVGPWDGYFTFELERRGAAEVVATDIGSPAGWDWPTYGRDERVAAMMSMSGEKTGQGFEVARSLLGSSARRVEMIVYDLSPESVGEFDVVVMGSLLLHLKDPVRALEAIRTVCRGWFLSSDQIDPRLTVLHRRRPVAENRGGENCQWWIPNVAAHRLMIRAAGFQIERAARPYAIPLGPGHPQVGGRQLARDAWRWLATRSSGLPHSAVLARPRD